MLRRYKDVCGLLLPTATAEKLVSMDLELLDETQNPLLKSRPFPANADDTQEIMRRIYECVSSNLAEEYSMKAIQSTAHPVSSSLNLEVLRSGWWFIMVSLTS